MKILVLILFYLNIFVTYSQIQIYNEILHGGSTGTGGGVNSGASCNPCMFNVQIPNGSTIRDAYLIGVFESSKENNSHESFTINLAGTMLNFNSHSESTNSFTFLREFNIDHKFSNLHIINVKDIISSSLNNVPFYCPTQPDYANGYYSYFYLYVVFENPNLPPTNVVLYVNNQDVSPITNLNLQHSNPISNNKPVGLGVMGMYFCDTVLDGSYIKVNNSNVGVLGGYDMVTNYFCSGPVPSYAYYNDTLFGLEDDTPDSIMAGPDALADIRTYINNLDTTVSVNFSYQSGQNVSGFYTNPVIGAVLNYTTPCAIIPAVVSSDTAICQGEQLQLHASGGTKYEWKCLTDTLPYGNSVYGLSCKNCANPAFSGDSSAVYTVRVWNGDSCSVVRPVRVTVNPKPKGVFSAVKTTCGEQKGVIKMQNNPVLQTFYALAENGDTLQSNYQNIPQVGAGNYTAFFIDTNGCKSNDSLVTVESFSNVVADFTVTPTSGGAPLGIHITNTSQNAQNYQWSINGQNVGNPPTHFDTSGTYIVQLIAWNQHPECADTMTKTVLVFDSLIVQIPNVFSPNNDGINDVFAIQTNLPVHIQAVILNRWGNEVFTCDKNLTVGNNAIWNGETKIHETVVDGTYFYHITFQLDDKVVDCNLQPCEVRKEGFVTVVR